MAFSGVFLYFTDDELIECFITIELYFKIGKGLLQIGVTLMY